MIQNFVSYNQCAQLLLHNSLKVEILLVRIILNFWVYSWIRIVFTHRHKLFLSDNNRKFQFRVISNLVYLFTHNSLLITFFSQLFPETRIINFERVKLFFNHFKISSEFIDNLIFLLDIIMVLLNYTFVLADLLI